MISSTNEPPYDKAHQSAPSEDSDQPGLCLVWSFCG